MAGLADLSKKEILEDEPTSSVPKNKSDYTEPYDPSAARGLAGIMVAGAGAFALRNPIGRIINKIANIRAPKPPAARTSQPQDAVEEVLEIVPTKVDRGRAMTSAQNKQQDEIRQMAIARSNELKKIAYHNPLSRGGKTNRIGSSLWDYIARHPVAGARMADDWIKDFKSTGPATFKSGNPDFKNISQAVRKEELWDSNIAQFDKNGNLIGGFLKVAQEKKIPLTKMDLLYIVEKSPVNNLVMRKLRYDPRIAGDSENLARDINNSLSNIKTKVLARPLPQTSENAARTESVIQDIDAAQKSVLKTNSNIYNQFKSGDQEYGDFRTSPFDKDIGNYESIVQRVRQLGVEVDPNEVSKITEVGKRNATEIFRRIQLQDTQKMTPKYGNYNDYRVKGGDEYFENVVYYPKPLPMGQKLSSRYQKHYSGIPNQVYHVRGSVRTGNGNQKVMMIDEIQSDYAQELRNVDPTRSKVVNAFGNEIEFFSSNRKLEKIVAQMRAIGNKGIQATKEEQKRFTELNKEFKEIKSNSLNLSNIGQNQASDGIPFLPLYGKENWGSHAVKNTIKDAAERGDVQWVGISPVEQLHHIKREKYLGDIEFYGNRFGKAGFKNYEVMSKVKDRTVKTDPKKKATLPSEMEKLARQYGSEVKTIEVAKSDPTKTYKVLETVKNDKKVYGLSKDSAGSHHKAAFKTKEEAEEYAERYGGAVEQIMEGNPKLYYEVFAIRISPEMKTKPFKAYQTGGLVVNIFA
jgi:hypothetical protein